MITCVPHMMEKKGGPTGAAKCPNFVGLWMKRAIVGSTSSATGRGSVRPKHPMLVDEPIAHDQRAFSCFSLRHLQRHYRLRSAGRWNSARASWRCREYIPGLDNPSSLPPRYLEERSECAPIYKFAQKGPRIPVRSCDPWFVPIGFQLLDGRGRV